MSVFDFLLPKWPVKSCFLLHFSFRWDYTCATFTCFLLGQVTIVSTKIAFFTCQKRVRPYKWLIVFFNTFFGLLTSYMLLIISLRSCVCLVSHCLKGFLLPCQLCFFSSTFYSRGFKVQGLLASIFSSSKPFKAQYFPAMLARFSILTGSAILLHLSRHNFSITSSAIRIVAGL